jgi:DNA-binding transcriptional MerR regulator
VRTLHHWDEVGLLSPQRAPSGHHRYSRADVARLYQIVALKRTGLSLDEIAALFASGDPGPAATLRHHLARVERELQDGRELRDRLIGVLAALEGPTGDASCELLKVIEKMTMFEDQLSPETRTWFIERPTEIGEENWNAAIEEWPELISSVRAEMDAGTDPGDAKVQRLMGRWNELQRLFIGDDPDTRTRTGEAWQAVRAEHAGELRRSPRVAPPEMWDYVQRARAAG